MSHKAVIYILCGLYGMQMGTYGQDFHGKLWLLKGGLGSRHSADIPTAKPAGF